MTFSEIKQRLKESEFSLRRWVNVLKKEGLLKPKKGPGNEDIFSEEDFATLSKAIELGKYGIPRPQVAAFLKHSQGVDTEAVVRLQKENNELLGVLIRVATALRREFAAPFWARVKWAVRPQASPFHEAMGILLQFLNKEEIV